MSQQPEGPDGPTTSGPDEPDRPGTTPAAVPAPDPFADFDDLVGEEDTRPEPLTPHPMPGEDTTLSTVDRLTVRLLGAGTIGLDATRRARLIGWLLPLAVTVFGGVLRFWHLDRPHALVFDETYYVKEAYSLLTQGYEGSWSADANPLFEAGNTSGLGSSAEYFVHPMVGKWMIALGMQLGGGVTSSFAWRLSVAVCGTLAILMVARIGRRLFASTALGTLAGLFMAVDGMGIVMSRTGLLDQFVMFFALASFGALVLDREQARRRLAVRVAAVVDAGGTLSGFGPRLGVRWWRLAAAVLLGLTCGTKWSGIYFLAVFGVVSVLWDTTARRTVGIRRWLPAGALRDGVPAGLAMVSIALATYLATWTSWFLSSNAWDRQWAADNPGQGPQWMPAALRSLWHFHLQMWHFHNTLTTYHPYEAHPIGWIVQWRPTSFFYPTSISGLHGAEAQAACGSTSCSQAITSLGNPLIWWLGAAAGLVALYWLVTRRDWRAGAVLSGIAAGWLPWFGYEHRTIFTFYSIAFLPWVVLTLAYVIGLLLAPEVAGDARTRRLTLQVVIGLVLLIVAVSAFFYPIWTAQIIPYSQWRLRMWLPNWI